MKHVGTKELVQMPGYFFTFYTTIGHIFICFYKD